MRVAVSRIRSRASWSLALFSAALPVALLTAEPPAEAASGSAAASLLAAVVWIAAAVMALLAALECVQHWSSLSRGMLWFGMIPTAGAALVGLLMMLATFGQ